MVVQDHVPDAQPGINPFKRSIFQRLWHALIKPSAGIEESDRRRQAALLSALLFGIAVITLLVESIYVALADELRLADAWVFAPEFIILGLLYGLSRSRYLRLGAILTMTAVSLAVFTSAWENPGWVLAGLFDFLLISIWLGSLYLGLSGLILLIAANLAGLVIFPMLVPEIVLNDILVGPFSFILVMSLILIVTNRHRSLLEADRRMELTDKEHQSRREAARAAALLRVAHRLNTQLEMEILLSSLSEEITDALNAPAAIVALYDQKLNVISPVSGAGLPPGFIENISALPKPIYDQTIKEFGTTFAIPDLQDIALPPSLDQYKRLNIRSVAFAAMEYERELIGNLIALSLGEPRVFSQDEILLLQGLADQAALAIVNTRLYKDAHRRLEHLQALRAIDVAIAANHDLRVTLELLLDKLLDQLQVDAAVFLLLDEANQQLDYAAGRGFHTPTLRYTSLRIGEGIAGRAAQKCQIIHIRNLNEDPQTLVLAPSLAREGFTSYIAAPLISQGQVKGVMEIFHRTLLDPDQEWLDFLEALAGQAAIAIQSTTLFGDLARTNEELSKAYDSTIEGWSRALDLRDKETEGHTVRVTELTLALARGFGFTDKEMLYIRRGGLLHDIGKMGVPDKILLKNGDLSPEEWEIMKQHPVYAHEMLLPIEYLRPALDIPYCHHEKWDGSGYPRGLKGEEIPLVARIFAVVDVWDALISTRPYRPGFTAEEALALIREGSGRHFDPAVVKAFTDLMKRREAG